MKSEVTESGWFAVAVAAVRKCIMLQQAHLDFDADFHKRVEIVGGDLVVSPVRVVVAEIVRNQVNHRRRRHRGSSSGAGCRKPSVGLRDSGARAGRYRALLRLDQHAQRRCDAQHLEGRHGRGSLEAARRAAGAGPD